MFTCFTPLCSKVECFPFLLHSFLVWALTILLDPFPVHSTTLFPFAVLMDQHVVQNYRGL